MRKYELTCIVKPDIDAAGMAALLDKVKGVLAADGGSVVKTEMWGMRRLGYPINKLREGQYVHMLVELDPAAVSRVENRIKLTEDIVRHLLVIAEDHKAPAPASSAEAPPVETPAAAPAETPAA